MKRLFLLQVCIVWLASMMQAVEVIDVLTRAELVPGGYSTQKEYTALSGAKYLYASHTTSNYIQINAAAKSGIAVTESPGVIKSIQVEFNKTEKTSKALPIFFSNTPYESYYTADVNNDYSPGDISEDVSKVELKNSYKYFYIRPNGAAYLNSITVVWEVPERTDAPQIISSKGVSFYPSSDLSFTAADGATVYYSIDNELTAENYASVGTPYTGIPVVLDRSATVYAIAVEADKLPSKVVSQTFACELAQYDTWICNWNDALFSGTDVSRQKGSEFGSDLKPVTTIDSGGFLFAFTKASGTDPAFYVSDKTVRVYNGTSTTITAPNDWKITKIIFTSASEVMEFASVVPTGATQAISGTTLTVEYPVGASVFEFGPPSKVQKWTSVEIEYKRIVDINTSFAPILSSSAGAEFYPTTTISIEAAEGSGSDVKFYYNINSDADPTPDAGIPYDGPFPVSGTSVVKAIAVDGNKAPSDVSTLTVKLIPGYESIAALLTAEPVPADAETVRLANPVTITGSYRYGNSNYLYVKDSTGDLLIYSTKAFPESYVAGAVIENIFMTYKLYKGLPEGIVTDYIDLLGEPVRVDSAPLPESVSTVDESLMNHYVVLDCVRLADGKILTVPELPVRAKFTGYTLPSDLDGNAYYRVEGMVGYESDGLVLYYLSSEKLLSVAAPEIYLEEDDLELATFDTRATFGMHVEGEPDAKIYYTIDGSDPVGNASARIYSEPVPITVTTTVKAYAVKEGVAPSPVVERTFTKTGTDAVYISDFLGMTGSTEPVRFVGDAVVTAHSADYLFIEGVLGHHLAIKAPAGWDSKYTAGTHISGFSIAHPEQAVDKLNLAIASVETFGSAEAGDEPVYPTVDASSLSDPDFAYGRVVVLTNSVLEGNDMARSANGWSVNGIASVDFAQFGSVDGWPISADATTGHTITAVVMPDDAGTPVVWPMAIAADGNMTSAPVINGMERFEHSTKVSITASAGATIYYTVDGTEPAAAAGGSTMLYDGEFEIAATTTVKAIAVVSGKEPSRVAVARFVETITTGIESVDDDNVNAIYGTVGAIVAPRDAEIYDLSGRPVNTPGNINPGIYIVRHAQRTVKVVVR